MQAQRIIEARNQIAQAAYAAMRRVEAEAALCSLSRQDHRPTSPTGRRVPRTQRAVSARPGMAGV
jgi:hypothetical protein